MKKTLSLASTALLLAACSAPAPPPETFQEWVEQADFSPEFSPYHMDMTMDMSIDLGAFMAAMPELEFEADGDEAEMVILYSVSGELDMRSIDVGRMYMDLEMDLSAIEDADLEGPIKVGMLMVSDGKTLYLEPEWKSAWIAQQLATSGQGFDRMVFTVKNSTLLSFIEVIGAVFEDQNPGLFGDLTYMEAMRLGMSPKGWVSSLDQYCVITEFEVVEEDVLIEFVMSDEYMQAIMSDPQTEIMMGMFEDMKYMVVIDLLTGMPKEMNFTISGPLQMTAAATFEARTADSWAAGTFEYTLPEDRNLFPIDQFMELAKAMVSSTTGPVGDDDFEF